MVQKAGVGTACTFLAKNILRSDPFQKVELQ